MPKYRALVSTYEAAALPVDWVTNSVYFNDVGITTNPTNLATDIATLFGTYRSMPSGWNRVNCRIYDMDDSLPRPVKGEFTYTVTAFSGTSGPREVALCLSYFSQQNRPRNRGRIFLGPWPQTFMLERPDSGARGTLSTLKTGLANIGGVDVKWCVYSPTTPGNSGDRFKQVSAGWIDDEWDTIRSRGRKATSRNPWTMEG